MEVVTKRIYNVTASRPIKIIPIGDIQLGAESVNEKYLKHVCDSVKNDPDTWWIMMGDACDFIQRNDPRFDPRELAHWIEYDDIDIVEQQLTRLYSYLDPIANKCLCVVKGNHEYAIEKHYERNPYIDIIKRIKEKGEMNPNEKLGAGYNGWLLLNLNRDGENTKSRSKTIRIRLNHGAGGGTLKGGKALSMERFLYQNNCDIALMGHNHEAGMPIRQIVWEVTGKGNVVKRKKIGAYTGTFMESEGDGYDTYGERKNYPPIPIGGIEIILNPHSENEFENRIKVVTGI